MDEKMNQVGTDSGVLPPIPPTPPVSETTVQVPGSATPAPERKTVTLDLETYENLVEMVRDMKRTQDAIIETTDRNQRNEIERRRAGGQLVKSVKVRKYDGKYALGWKMLENDAYVNTEGKLIENQKVKVFFEDKTEKEMPYKISGTLYELEEFEVIRESRESDGTLYFTVKGEDGKELTIGAAYVN